MDRDYRYAVLIGRFQPLHNDHMRLIEQALQIANSVLILVGSAHSARTPKNPFTFEERKAMIEAVFAHEVGTTQRVHVEPIRDYFYSDDVWLANVQATCSQYFEDGDTVALLGEFKDSSSYYLNLFPHWEYVAPNFRSPLDATKIRTKLLDVGVHMRGWADKEPGGVPVIKRDVLEAQDKFFGRNVPPAVCEFLKEFRGRGICGDLCDEFYAIQEYKKSWGRAPHPPTFTTADAVVTCAGHVLVVKRGGNPGKGLLALPGGFVREHERIQAAALRETKEETRIKVDKIILESSIVDSAVFDYPGRSLRGRTITHAFHVKLKDGKLPEVKHGDDAAGAFWLPMMEVNRRCDEFFEDHVHIINHFIQS